MMPKVKGNSKPPVPPSLEEAAGAMLRELGMEEDDLGHTLRELAKAWRVSDSTAKRRVRILKEEGKIIEGRRTIKDAMDRPQRIRVVRLKENKDIERR